MTSIKSLTTLFLAATFVGLGGCGQTDNQGPMDDSGMSDTAPGTTGDTAGTANDPYATTPPGQDDTMTAPQSEDTWGEGAGSTTDPNAPGTSDEMSPSEQGGVTEETPPPAQ